MKTFSVRFYKRLLLLILALLILIPTVLAVVFGIQNASLRRQLAEGGGEVRPSVGQQPVGDPLDYQAMYPELYSSSVIPEERLRVSNTAYLTFDCIPSANTEALLDILDTYGVKATFFVKGTEDQTVYPILKKIVERGHTIGLHGFSDSYQQIYSSVGAFLEDFKAAYDMVYEAAGVRAEIFRYPGGSINPYNCGIYRELNAEMLRRSFVFFDWSVSGALSGQEEQTGEQIRENVRSGLEGMDRAIIALQDEPGQGAVADALPGIIEDLRSAGFSLQTLTASVMPVIYGY